MLKEKIRQSFTILKFAIDNSGSLFLMKTFGIVINYVALLIILHFFGFKGNGEVANFIAQAKGLMIVFVFGLDIVLVKKLNEDQREISSILETWKILIINFLLGSVLFYVVSLFISIDISFLLGGIVFAIWRFLGHFYRGKNNMLLYGFYEFIVIQFSVLIAIFLARFTSLSLIHSIVLINAILIVVLLVWFFMKYGSLLIIHFKIRTNFNKIINQYKESYHFVLSSSILIISTAVLYLIVKTSYSTVILGVYDSILKFSLVITLPLIATNGRVMVLTSRYYNQKEEKELNVYITKTTKMLAYMSTLFAVLVIAGYYIYSTYFNVSFQNYWILFLLLIIAQLINNWAGPVGVVLQLTDNEKIYNLITFLTSFYLLLSSLIIAKYLPVNYIAINYIVYMFLQNGASLLLVKKRLKINPYKI